MPLDQCRVHISDLGLQRGYGVFDYFRAINGKIWWKEDYYARLWQSIESSYLHFPLTPDDLDAVCDLLQSDNQLEASAFKVIVTGGMSEDMGSYSGHSTFAVIQRPFILPDPKYYTEGAALITYPYQRPEPKIKSLNYYFSTRLYRQIQEASAIDVLFYGDNIRETARSNFFGIKKGVIHTPHEGVLEGITRKHLLQLNRKGFIFDQRAIPFSELYSFDEVFITGTTKEVMPIVKIDNQTIGSGKPGPVTKELMQAYRQAVTENQTTHYN